MFGVEFGAELARLLLKYLQAGKKSPEQYNNLKNLGIVKTTSHVAKREQDVEVRVGVGEFEVFQGEDR